MFDEFESSARLLPPAEEKAVVQLSLELPPAEEQLVLQPLLELLPPEEKVVEPPSSEPLAEDKSVAQPSSELPPAEEKAVVPSSILRPMEEKIAPQSSKGEKAADRPFRVKLRGSVLVLVRLPNKRSLRAALHQLSTTGGVIHFEKPLDEKLEVELIFHLQKTTIRSKAQLLFPMWATQGWMQPFRFVNLTDANRGILDASLKSFLSEGATGAAAGA